jgi:hypothetical protein
MIPSICWQRFGKAWRNAATSQVAASTVKNPTTVLNTAKNAAVLSTAKNAVVT